MRRVETVSGPLILKPYSVLRYGIFHRLDLGKRGFRVCGLGVQGLGLSLGSLRACVRFLVFKV